MKNEDKPAGADTLKKIQSYLGNGGLFNLERQRVKELEKDKARLDWLEKHSEGLTMLGSGAADDKWWTLIYHDGNTVESGTIREAIDQALSTPTQNRDEKI